jgi:hypothetical protein
LQLISLYCKLQVSLKLHQKEGSGLVKIPGILNCNRNAGFRGYSISTAPTGKEKIGAMGWFLFVGHLNINFGASSNECGSSVNSCHYIRPWNLANKEKSLEA